MQNHLSGQLSPYLLQHAENPVDWYPWCEAAFMKAKAEDKPVFLSIGYSTCHWCHVMARESFEDTGIASVLNRDYICIKVDREERPDIDSVYMAVCEALTGSGGWPLSIFMTWDKQPFFAGTYFPKQTSFGMTGFAELLAFLHERWQTDRASLLRTADQLTRQITQKTSAAQHGSIEQLYADAARWFQQSYDPVYGGFGGAPKFPTPHNLLFLMYYAEKANKPVYRKMAETTLLQMRKGGIFDQIGFGFSRYSTDRFFLAPHFEKMLYDNALLIIACTAACSVTKEPLYLQTAQETADYILREMTAPDGGFYSAQDADSEGEEGAYYTFTPKEILRVLGERDGARFNTRFDITERGNFHGANIPNLLKSGDLKPTNSNWLQKLRQYRKARSVLRTDDKILTSWNAMMIASLCMLYRVSGKDAYLDSARQTQEMIENNLREGDALFAARRGEQRGTNGFLDDYAWYATALTELYHSTLNRQYLDMAARVFSVAHKQFYDEQHGGYFQRAAQDTDLLFNPKEVFDGAIPGGNAVMAYVAVRLSQLTENKSYEGIASAQLRFLQAQATDSPAAHCFYLLAHLLHDAPPKRIRIVKEKKQPLPEDATKLFLADVTVEPPSPDYPLLNHSTTYYVCEGHICLPPTNRLSVLHNK